MFVLLCTGLRLIIVVDILFQVVIVDALLRMTVDVDEADDDELMLLLLVLIVAHDDDVADDDDSGLGDDGCIESMSEV